MSLPKKEADVTGAVRKITNITTPLIAIVLVYYLWQFGYFG